MCLLCEDKKCYSKGSLDQTQATKVKIVCDLFNSEFTQQDGKTLDWKTWRGYYLRVLSGIHLTLMFFFCSSTKRSVWRNVKFGEEEKRRFCLNHAKPLKSPHPSLWTIQSCFLSWNWFFECAHPFLDKPMVKNWARYTKQTAIRLCWPGGLIAGLHVMSRRPCWWSRTKTFVFSGN